MSTEASTKKQSSGEDTEGVSEEPGSVQHDNLQQVQPQATQEKLSQEVTTDRQSNPPESHQTVEGNFRMLQENLKECEEVYTDIIRKQQAEIQKMKDLKPKRGKDTGAIPREHKEPMRQGTDEAENTDRTRKTTGTVNLAIDPKTGQIAERYNKLYDNQWTDAYEKAEKLFPDLPEKKRIQLLMKLLLDVYTFCKKDFEQLDKELRNALQRVSRSKVKPPDDVLMQVRDYWRSSSEDCIESLLEEYLKPSDTRDEMVQKLATESKEFARECVAVCWQMLHQEPPVVFDLDDQNQTFDEHRYKIYSKSGSKIDYAVWPALLLHDGGSVLAKGVVQCKEAPPPLPPRQPNPQQQPPTAPHSLDQDYVSSWEFFSLPSQQEDLSQGQGHPSTQYPQHLIPSKPEWACYFQCIQYYGFNQNAKCYVDSYLGQGVFDKCYNYHVWLQERPTS